MTKVVDVSVFETARRVRDGQWQGGVLQFGLKEGGVDYVFDEHNSALIGDKVRARVEALRKDIIAGKIHVPDGTEKK
jgi:basic membrane protein A